MLWILIVASAAPLRAQALKPIDWDALTAEASDMLSKYVQIDTTNPPGNELAAARFLREKFLAEGIPAVVFEPAPGRGIVAARLRGIGHHRKAVILLSHMDVVGADPRDWSQPPFSGVVKDGAIWGRGTLDDKGPGIIELMAMLAIKRARILLDRDILFIATGDEEAGGKLGAGWLVEHQPDLYGDAGFVLNEDGGIRVYKNGQELYAVTVTEKSPLWLRLTINDSPGHGSIPPLHSSITRIVKAVNRLIDYNADAPVKVLPVVQQYFARLNTVIPKPNPELAHLAQALKKDPQFAKEFLSVPYQSALVRNTITPTRIDAGYKINVVPSTATADLDCRLLPGQDDKGFIKVVREVAADGGMKIDELLNAPSVSSPEKSPLMEAIVLLSRKMDKEAVVTPAMTNGFSDCHYFREHGLTAYGFMPIPLTEADLHGIHGANERLPVKDLTGGLQRMVALLEILGGK
jgi:acetylornithine deacetylase/succinyl-diaminopimelate desuccinylase-like protein